MPNAVQKADRYIAEMVGEQDFSTKTARRNNNVKRGVPTYHNQGEGKGAAQNAADMIRKRKKMLDEI